MPHTRSHLSKVLQTFISVNHSSHESTFFLPLNERFTEVGDCEITKFQHQAAVSYHGVLWLIDGLGFYFSFFIWFLNIVYFTVFFTEKTTYQLQTKNNIDYKPAKQQKQPPKIYLKMECLPSKIRHAA